MENLSEMYRIKTEKMVELFDRAIAAGNKSGFTINCEPNFQVNSNVAIVVDHKFTNEFIMNSIKKLFESNNCNWYDVYITPFTKSENKNVNVRLLENELKIVQPKRVLYLGFPVIVKYGETYSISKERFDTFLMMAQDETKRTDCYTALRNEFLHAIVNFAGKGVAAIESV